jgi:hypothetical protein
VATALGVLLVPVLFVVIEKLVQRFRRQPAAPPSLEPRMAEGGHD